MRAHPSIKVRYFLLVITRDAAGPKKKDPYARNCLMLPQYRREDLAAVAVAPVSLAVRVIQEYSRTTWRVGCRMRASLP
jgi:hypothetical protein